MRTFILLVTTRPTGRRKTTKLLRMGEAIEKLNHNQTKNKRKETKHLVEKAKCKKLKKFPSKIFIVSKI